jgi:hypothetical protein
MVRRKKLLIACTALLGMAATACMHPGPPVAGPAPVMPVPPSQSVTPAPAPTAPITAPSQTIAPIPEASPPAAPTPPARLKEKTAPASKSSAKPSGSMPAAASTPPAQTPPAVRAAPAPPTLDLASLEQRLRDTHAIGIMTKLSLKNQVDDLLADLRKFHSGSSSTTLAQLRQSYELLLLKVVSLLQNGDPQLATAVSGSREAIWSLLSDPVKFAQLS